MELTIFDKSKQATGYFTGDIDMELGDSDATNDFVIDDSVSMGMYIAAQGEEYGGIVEYYEDDIDMPYKGHTWRGLLNQWIIEPPEGSDHLVVGGDLNDIIRTVTADVLGGFFDASEEKCGIEAYKYSFAIGCSVLDGLMDLCSDHGCKLVIRNVVIDERLHVVLSAKKAEEKTLSEESFDAKTTISNMGINHLICAGTGELKNRLKVHLYMWPDGSVRQNPYYTGFAERQAFYDYNTQDDLAELIKSGGERLKSLASYKKMEVNTAYVDADVGDYLQVKKNGMVVNQPVVRKILSGSNGIYSIEAKMKGES